jgi:hypothetical protein
MRSAIGIIRFLNILDNTRAVQPQICILNLYGIGQEEFAWPR